MHHTKCKLKHRLSRTLGNVFSRQFFKGSYEGTDDLVSGFPCLICVVKTQGAAPWSEPATLARSLIYTWRNQVAAKHLRAD